MKAILKEIVRNAIEEDLPSGDLTTDLLRMANRQARAKLIAKDDLVVCGVEAFEEVFHQIDPDVKIQWHFKEGDLAISKQCVATVSGPCTALLKAERVALNFIGYMSGIATLTRCFVKQVEHTQCKILDTRKTRPGHRELEKFSVKMGGAENHRMHLSEAILVKENHFRCFGGFSAAIEQIKEHTPLPIEVEVSNLDELKTAIDLKVDRVLLDNMSTDEIREAVKMCPPQIQTEASGNMNLDRVQEVADTGVHFISVGAITHSAPCADYSLLIQE